MPSKKIFTFFALAAVIDGMACSVSWAAPICPPGIPPFTPAQMEDSSEIVLEGKIASASCFCNADLFGRNSAECQEVVEVVRLIKGAPNGDVTINVPIRSDNPLNCEAIKTEMPQSLIGTQDVFYLKHDGDDYIQVPHSSCEN